MEIKILQVFYGKDGLPYKDKDRQVHFPIAGTGFLGASNTTKIKFYYDELDNLDETTWVAVSKLPNGKVGSRVLESHLDEELNEHYALLELDNYYTQYKGDVFISLQGYQGGVDFDYDEENSQYEIHGTPTIAATGSIKFTINYANQFVGSGETDNINFQRILAALGTKLGMRAYSEHVEELPSEGSPDVFYVVNDDPNNPNLANIYVWNENTKHYIWVGDNTLDLGDYYTQEQGDQFENDIDGRVTNVENELQSVASGSPRGVYATVSDLTTADPNHNYIYLVLSDSKWYYWNGSAWTAGGTYLSGPFDDKLSLGSTNAVQNVVLANLIFSIQKALNKKADAIPNKNKYNYETNVSGFLLSDGNIESSSSYFTTYFIDVSNFTNNIYFNMFARKFLAYDGNFNPIDGTYEDNGINAGVIRRQASWKYVRFSFLVDCYDLVIVADSNSPVTYEPYTQNAYNLAFNDNQKIDIENIISDYLFEIGINKVNPETFVVGYLNGDGSISNDANYKTTDYIDVSEFENGYAISPHFRKFLAYDENKNVISSSYITDETQASVITLNSNWKYIRVTFFEGENNYIVADSLSVVTYVPYNLVAKDGVDYANEYTMNSIKKEIPLILTHLGKNKLNPNTLVNGFLLSDGNIESNENYETTDYIDVSNFTKGYAINKPYRKFLAYDENKSPIASSWLDNGGNAGVITLNSNYKYVRFTLFVNNKENAQLEDNTENTLYEPYERVVNDGIDFLNTETKNAVMRIAGTGKSVLSEKKWYACGDSFTHGDFNGGTEDLITDDGPYKGQYKVYPYIIGNRTGANVQNIASNGMTLAIVYQGRGNSFTENDWFKNNIPADADYITLYFGINDGHQSVPIGTINDETPTTFYGALNYVFEWLITNRPNAKIGVIVSNGCDNIYYPTATISACKKWGIAYLDINGDETLPYVIRTNMRTNLSQDARDIYDPLLMVKYESPNANHHPNGLAHEKESYMIQQFLERL